MAHLGGRSEMASVVDVDDDAADRTDPSVDQVDIRFVEHFACRVPRALGHDVVHEFHDVGTHFESGTL